jgi:hypothetical protein
MTDQQRISCRQARRLLPMLVKGSSPIADINVLRQHIGECADCGREYRILALSRATLDAAASNEQIVPDTAFFKGLRARIERGEHAPHISADESWAAALFLTARQLVPAMALLLLLIIGATLLWNMSHRQDLTARQESYELQEPRPDDSLESIVALEERRNGK